MEEGTEDHNEDEGHSGHHYLQPSDPRFWKMIALVVVCTLTGAFCSGLAVGMFSIEPIELEIMSMSDDPKER